MTERSETITTDSLKGMAWAVPFCYSHSRFARS